MERKKYDPRNEHKVDINSPAFQTQIAQVRQMYQDFVEEFSGLDLRDEAAIERAYEATRTRGLLDRAAEIKELIFGRDVTTYGVSYVSDSCKSGCKYCPLRRDSIDVETGKPIKRKTLSLEEFICQELSFLKLVTLVVRYRKLNS